MFDRKTAQMLYRKYHPLQHQQNYSLAHPNLLNVNSLKKKKKNNSQSIFPFDKISKKNNHNFQKADSDKNIVQIKNTSVRQFEPNLKLQIVHKEKNQKDNNDQPFSTDKILRMENCNSHKKAEKQRNITFYCPNRHQYQKYNKILKNPFKQENGNSILKVSNKLVKFQNSFYQRKTHSFNKENKQVSFVSVDRQSTQNKQLHKKFHKQEVQSINKNNNPSLLYFQNMRKWRKEYLQKQSKQKPMVCAADCFKGKRPYNQDRYICLINCLTGMRKNSFLKKKQFSLHSEDINSKKDIRSKSSHQNGGSEKSKSFDLYGVFDGHGGHRCSEFLKEKLYETLRCNKSMIKNPAIALKQTVNQLEEMFMEVAVKHGNVDASGSCAIISLIADGKIYIANVGDSRALFLNKHNLRQITTDHKPDEVGEKNRIVDNGGQLYKEGSCMKVGRGVMKIVGQTRVMPGGLNVSRTIGDIESKQRKYGGCPGVIVCEPQIFVEEVQNNECLLLASDGLFEGLTNEQIHNIYLNFRSENPSKNQANLLVKELISQSGIKSNDNITVICVFLH